MRGEHNLRGRDAEGNWLYSTQPSLPKKRETTTRQTSVNVHQARGAFGVDVRVPLNRRHVVKAFTPRCVCGRLKHWRYSALFSKAPSVRQSRACEALHNGVCVHASVCVCVTGRKGRANINSLCVCVYKEVKAGD